VPGGGYYPYPATVQKTNGLAIASLVVSIVGAVMLVCYGIGGLISIVGAILGHVARRQIRERQEGGDGMALAGVIVGWIVTAIAALVVAVVVVLFVMAMNSLPSEPSLQQLGWRRLT
jgi:MFS family permease